MYWQSSTLDRIRRYAGGNERNFRSTTRGLDLFVDLLATINGNFEVESDRVEMGGGRV
jgi:hypothetical protein